MSEIYLVCVSLINLSYKSFQLIKSEISQVEICLESS